MKIKAIQRVSWCCCSSCRLILMACSNLMQYARNNMSKWDHSLIDINDPKPSLRSARLRFFFFFASKRLFHGICVLETAWHYHASAVLVANWWFMREGGLIRANMFSIGPTVLWLCNNRRMMRSGGALWTTPRWSDSWWRLEHLKLLSNNQAAWRPK